MSDISRFLSVFHRPHVGVIQAARQLLSDEQAPLRQKLLADLLHTISENITAETRAQDPPWFEGAPAVRAWRALGAGGPPRAGPLGEAGLHFSSQSEGPPRRGARLLPADSRQPRTVGTDTDTQFSIPIVVKGTAQGPQGHSRCRARVTATLSRTFRLLALHLCAH